MPQVLKDNSVIEDIWLVLDESFNSFPDGDLLIPYNQWESLAAVFLALDFCVNVITTRERLGLLAVLCAINYFYYSAVALMPLNLLTILI